MWQAHKPKSTDFNIKSWNSLELVIHYIHSIYYTARKISSANWVFRVQIYVNITRVNNWLHSCVNGGKFILSLICRIINIFLHRYRICYNIDPVPSFSLRNSVFFSEILDFNLRNSYWKKKNRCRRDPVRSVSVFTFKESFSLPVLTTKRCFGQSSNKTFLEAAIHSESKLLLANVTISSTFIVFNLTTRKLLSKEKLVLNYDFGWVNNGSIVE